MIDETIISRKEIDITPDTSLLPKIGKSGYTLTQSLAELVDNSIDARLPRKLLTINIYLYKDSISIEDNAIGMTFEEATKALKLGYSEKKNALGEFGLGLKSASTSLGESFVLKSYPFGKREGCKYKYVEKDWYKKSNTKGWKDEMELFEKAKSKHGTEIRITDLTRRYSKQRKKEVLEDFSKRFAPFIKSGEVEIFVNQEKCIPKEHELTEEGKTNFTINASGNNISGWYGLMKKGSDKGHYGFSTFRRGRMITYFDKLGIPSHPTVSRIVGEIHLNHVPVSHSKKEFEVESDEYKEAVILLEKEFKNLVKKARQVSLASKISKEIKNFTDNWKAAIARAFHTDIQDLLEIGKAEKKKSASELDPVSSIIIEKRSSPLHQTMQKIIEKRERIRSPRDNRQIVISNFITINGKRFNIEHDFAKLGEESGWMDYDFSESKGLIVVLTNEDFPAFAVTKDIPFYAAIHIAEAIADITVKVGGYNYEQVDVFKQKMIKRASEYLEEFK